MKRLTNRQWLATLTCALFYLLPATTAQAQPPIFVEPPAPERLATLLVPPRYRSIDGRTNGDHSGFGMMINFELNSADILPESLPLLESVGEMLKLKRVAERVVMIAGHADARGTHAYNQSLSERRAQTIKSYLVESFDIEPARLLTVGYGEANLYDSADPLNGVNRRVEFSAASGISIQ